MADYFTSSLKQTLAKGLRFPHKSGIVSFLGHVQAAINAAQAVCVYQPGTPAALKGDAILDGEALGEEASTITSFIAQPDVPRVLSIKGVPADAALTGDVVITGTNINGEAISETLALNGANTVNGTKAFASVTSIALPGYTTVDDAIDVGWTDKLGLDNAIGKNSVLFVTFDGVQETTAPVVTFDADDISKCTVDPNTALNPAKEVEIAYLV